MASIRVEWRERSILQVKDVETVITLGRSSDCDIVIDDESISGKHACIRKVGEKFIISDLHSMNGVVVNDVVVKERQLDDGDIIMLSEVICTFSNPLAPKSNQADRATRDTEPGDRSIDARERDSYKELATEPGTGPAARGPVPGIELEKRQPQSLRVASALALAGGLTGPLFLGVGWLLGILLGAFLLNSDQEDLSPVDSAMARWGIFLGLLWVAAGIWVLYFLFVRS